jgi:flavorubredoxin
MARIDEIAPDLYRLSIYAPQFDLQFNHFLINDDEPLLFHTGMRRMFPEVRDAVAQLIDPAALRWISWSHFEVDECGALKRVARGGSQRAGDLQPGGRDGER